MRLNIVTALLSDQIGLAGFAPLWSLNVLDINGD
jgi:hypothetical protein